MIVHPGSNFSSELFSLPCLWFEGKKFSWEKIYIWVCFHQWKHVGAKITFRRSFFSYMIFPFCRVKVSKTIFSEELNQIFSVCFLKFFFFFSVFRRFCGPANITEFIKFSYFLGVWNHVEKMNFFSWEIE